MYGITPEGGLYFYQDLARNGTVNWANGGTGQQIGNGWFVTSQASDVEGYAWPLSVAPGEQVTFFVSAASDYRVTYMRLKPGPGGLGVAMTPSFFASAGLQSVPADAWQDGCGWNASFNLVIPEDWPSGIYAAECKDILGRLSHIVFVVKPAVLRTRFAALVNTNTWNAYNDWGGRSKYTPPPRAAAHVSFLRPNPYTTPVDDGQINHLTRAELWLLGWLEDHGFGAPELFTDADFDAGIPSFGQYDALFLNTHPEYWTDAMRDNFDAYLASGGSVIYLGGNGLFERVSFIDGGTALQAFGGDPAAGRDPSAFRNATPPRPERAVLGVQFLYNNYFDKSPPSPYQVMNAAHPFFAGTGVKNGDLIGKSGHNGPASGWEMDTSDPGTAPDGVIVTSWEGSDRGVAPANLEVLALGTNPYGDGNLVAHMTTYRHPAGGLVFAAGSLCFTGSFAVDPILQQIVANVAAAV